MATAKRDLTDTKVQGHPERAEQLLTVREVARRLAVSATTVYRLKAQGRIGFLKVGGGLRFRESDVAQYQTRQLVAPTGYAEHIEEAPVRLNLKFPVANRRRRRAREA